MCVTLLWVAYVCNPAVVGYVCNPAVVGYVCNPAVVACVLYILGSTDPSPCILLFRQQVSISLLVVISKLID